MIDHCSLSQPWINNDFTPCFRETFIDGVVISAILLWSLVTITKASIKHYKSSRYSEYSTLLKLPSNANNYYGATLPSSLQDENEDTASDNTVTYMDVEISASRWSIYNLSRFLISLAQLALFVNSLLLVRSHTYPFSPNEGKDSDILIDFVVRTAFWTYSLILSTVVIYLSSSFNKLANKICNQLSALYGLIFMVTLIDIRSYYTQNVDIHALGYKLSLISGALELILICIIINESRLTPTEPIVTEDGRVLSGENWASLYSKFMFSWVDTMMKKGYHKTLNDADLNELPANNRTKYTLNNFNKNKTSSKTGWTMIKTFKWDLFYQAFYCLSWSLFIFGPPYFLNLIIKYIEDPQGKPVSSAFLYVLGLFVTSSVQSLSYQQGLYIGRTISIRIQSIIIGEVFAKSLRRRDDSGSPSNEKEQDNEEAKGNVNNLLSVDAQKVAEFSSYAFYLYSYPIQISICIWSLYKLLGVASLWGVLVMILCQPLTYYVSKYFGTVQGRVMSAKDKRLKFTTELLSAIRIVKFFAWESEFQKRIIEARKKELSNVRAGLMLFVWMSNIWFLIPVLMMVVAFYIYTLDHALTASVAFTSLALFNTLRGALDEFPFIVTFLAQASISLKRVDKFLAEDEIDLPQQLQQTANTHGVAIGFIDNATFSWEKDSSKPPAIKNLNLSFPVGKLSIICGPTGSGKTTLVASLLGETRRISGHAILPRIVPNKTSPLGGAVSGIAYVAQTAWLQNCSVRDNILFGLPYDEDRYASVLYMTALTRDLDILEFGDATEVGEKGITLSGGQKQRVAIARAVYSQASTVILDDCLSAVDAHTAKHLFEHCLNGPLMKERTVILVTHHVSLCLGSAAYVVALKDGQVVQAGTPKELLASNALGEEVVFASEEQKEAQEQEAAEGPIPTVPKTVTLKKNQDSNGGKLVQEEERAEGGVSWSVYKTYIEASGGYVFWISVLVLFGAAQATILGQDYWIKVWSAAYRGLQDDQMNVFSVHSTASTNQVNFISFYSEPIIRTLQTYTYNVESIDTMYYLGVYFLIGLVALLMTTLRTLFLFNGSLKASIRIHNNLLSKILRAKVRFYDTTPLGRIVNRFSSDLSTIDQDVAPSLSLLLYSLVATVCIIMLISSVTPTFLVPGVLIALMFVFIGNYYLRTSRDMKRLNSVTRSPIYVQFNETVNGVITIRAFGSQIRFLNENHQKIDSNNRPFIWMWATNRWLHCRVDILGAFVGFCTGFVLILARSWIDPGLAGLSLSYSLTFTHHILWVVRQYAMNEMNMNAIERVHEYLGVEEEPAAFIEETEPRVSWPEEGAVEVKNLVMQYAPENPAVLRNVSFKIKPREKVGIVGRTGSGKSTLALSIFRFMEPTSGTIEIDGVDIHKIGLNTLRSRLTIIPQDPVLFSGTLRSNLDPFNSHTDAELWASIKRAHLINQNEENGNPITLESPVAENGSNWSQGQRQLIALARALVKKSSLIILDEATSSVDFDTDHKIQQTIRSEFVDSSLLCIAHRIRTVADYDRILVLDHGEIKEFDTPYTLMTREGSIFQQMCIRSGEYEELLSISKAKEEATSSIN